MLAERKKAVARFTRAWIETLIPKNRSAASSVARFTRAWIETCPSRSAHTRADVARFTRAWIETYGSSKKSSGETSPASRGRGLKP